MKKENVNINWAWRVVYPYLSYIGIYYVVYMLAAVLAVGLGIAGYKMSGGGALDYSTVMGLTVSWMSAYSSEISIAGYLLALPVMLLFLKMDRNRLGSEAGKYDRVFPAYYAVVLILGACACVAVNGLMYISGLMEVYSENLSEVSSELYQGQLIVELLGIGILSPVVEEFIFRGLTMRRLKEVFTPTISIIITSCLFAVVHANLLQIIYAFILGLIFSYLYEKFHSILAPILAHAGANIVSVLGSETNLLDGLLETETTLMISTAVCLVVIIACLYLVQYRVDPKPLHDDAG